MVQSTTATSDSKTETTPPASEPKPAAAPDIRWYAPPGHGGQAVLQVKAGDGWVDVPTVTEL